MKTSSQLSPATTVAGTLFIVATPIGNLGDISHRALETLSTVNLIACEDTRHTKKLCRHFAINTPLTSYYREQERKKAKRLLQLLKEGQNLALVSDAGTPGISDPGGILIRAARKEGISIIAIPGPSALTAAISIAGLQDISFLFTGFLPAKKAARRQFLHSVASLPFTLIFYESPHRIQSSLSDMYNILGDRPTRLFRELTKIHEECLDGSLSTLIEQVKSGIKGELVLIIDGAELRTENKPENLDELISWYRDELGSSLKDAVKNIATDLDLPRSQVYKTALSVWKTDS